MSQQEPLWPPGTIVMTASGGPPQSAAERARKTRLRRKIGYEPFSIDLPPLALRDFLVRSGRIAAQRADDRDAQCLAVSILICGEIHKHNLASQCDADRIPLPVERGLFSDQTGAKNNVEPVADHERARAK